MKSISKTKQLITQATAQAVPPWIAAMREAAQGCLSPDDVKEIVRNQVAKAKGGDQRAIDWVFKQLVGTGQPMTVIQQNVYGGELDPFRPTRGQPGSPLKKRLMAIRAEAGEPVAHPRDATGDDEQDAIDFANEEDGVEAG